MQNYNDFHFLSVIFKNVAHHKKNKTFLSEMALRKKKLTLHITED